MNIMGYTHYFKRTGVFTNKEWKDIVEICTTLYHNMPKHSHSSGGVYCEAPLKLSGCFAYEHPVFDKEMIHFNGWNGLPRSFSKGEWKDKISNKPTEYFLCHETFHLTKAKSCEDFNFCKTDRKPYDLMVQACLIVAKCVAPKKLQVSTDGDYDDWKDAFQFVGKHFKHATILDAITSKGKDFWED
jgi:hypothetical protein